MLFWSHLHDTIPAVFRVIGQQGRESNGSRLLPGQPQRGHEDELCMEQGPGQVQCVRHAWRYSWQVE